MAEDIEDLKDFATSISNSISKLSAAERKRNVTGELAAEYNKLRAMTLEVLPEREQLIPPIIVISNAITTGPVKTQTAAAHVDLDSYCQRIFRLLSKAVS